MGGKNDLIKQEYIKAKGKINLKDLATKHKMKYATVRSIKSRDKWDEDINQVENNATVKRNTTAKACNTNKDNATVATVNNKVDKNIKNEVQQADQCNNQTATPATDLDEIEKIATLHMKLTSKQIIFCQEFIIDFNGSRAAIAAGYSKNSARSIASNLLTKPNIQAVIRKFQKCAMQNLDIDTTKIIMEYASIAFSDITNYVDVGRKKITTLDKEGKKVTAINDYCHLKLGQLVNANTIQEIKISDQGTFIKMHDKHKALDFLTKYAGMTSNDNVKNIEIQKLKLLQAKLKIEEQKGILASDNGNIDELIKSITSIDLTVFEKAGENNG